jgi:uncharacterized protein YbjT (DUF2867 family)
MLLVTGATGTTGVEVLRGLREHDVQVRALVHDETKADGVRELGAEPVIGEMGDPKTLEPALEGVERAYLVAPLSPMQAEYEQVFVETAKAAGVQHVVKLSLIGASRESPLRFGKTHAVVEQALRESGMAWTFLRPNGFMQNNLAWPERVRDGTFYSPVPDAAFSIVDARDVAEVAVAALTGDGHAGKAYALTGPEAVSYRDQARRLFAAAGREVTVEEVATEAVKQALVQAGVPPWNAEGLAELWELYASGAATLVASGVEDVLHRAPRDLDTFARDHADAFKAQPAS